MSGTVAYMARKRAEQEKRFAAIRAQAEAADALRVNREEVQVRLEALVKEAAGWSQIDSDFQSVIAAAANGQTVDLDELDSKITAWKTAQTTGTEAK